MNKDKPVEVVVPFVLEGKNWNLVKYRDNWADEIEIYGFRVMHDDQLEKWKQRIPNDYVFGIGSNEEIEYETKQDLLDCITVIPLDANQAKMMYDLFKGPNTRFENWNGERHMLIERQEEIEWGHFPLSDDEWNCMNEENE